MKKSVLFFIVLTLVSVSTCFGLEAYKSNVTASFYGADFHGKKTSNGEHFNMYDYTCANKELPFDTILKVTNLSNGKTVQVRVNDRGPFVVGREIDLSTAAAKALDMMKVGTTKVKLEIVKLGPNTKLSRDTANSAKKIMIQRFGTNAVAKSNEETKPAAKTTVTTKKSEQPKTVAISPDKIWDIQVASFTSRENAEKFANELYNKGFKKLVYQSTKDITRVVVSKVPSKDVEKIASQLRDAGYNDFVVKERKNG